MSKAPINFNSINKESLGYLQNFAEARIAIAKEDQRHKEVLKPLRLKLDTIHQNRETDLAQGIKLLEERLFSSTMGASQLSKLFMSIFCDILSQNGVITINI